MRSWRSALDKIYYHNAYGVSANYTPKSETERALQDSLRELENQCKERVDLLEALRQSRKDAEKDEKRHGLGRDDAVRKQPDKIRSNGGPVSAGQVPGFIGNGTIPAVAYPDLSKPPALPKRPIVSTNKSSDSLFQLDSNSSTNVTALPSLPPPTKVTSRSPSPDQRKTMLRTLRKDGKNRLSSSSSRMQERRRSERPAASKAAGLAWDSQSHSRPSPAGSNLDLDGGSQTLFDASLLLPQNPPTRRSSEEPRRKSAFVTSPADYIPPSSWREPRLNPSSAQNLDEPWPQAAPETSAKEERSGSIESADLPKMQPPPVPAYASGSVTPTEQFTKQLAPSALEDRSASKPNPKPLPQLSKPPELSYRREYPISHSKQVSLPYVAFRTSSSHAVRTSAPVGLSRRPVATTSSPHRESRQKVTQDVSNSSGSGDDVPATPTTTVSQDEPVKRSTGSSRPAQPKRKDSSAPPTPSTDASSSEDPQTDDMSDWDKRAEKILKNLPRGVDEQAARNILNDVVVQGDEVHWDDVAGLEIAKKALKEAVVYPFLRPDLFMGLREPARGMLLFGPPGTGKTMLAKAVATESKSTFFAISASSLTSKWHGESEKLVKALFSLAKVLAPSIIFVDEIDSLLSARSSSSEHEASRRSKTEFLIQWSDLQRAAAGSTRDSDKSNAAGGDPTRVLVLAATNVPWDIDDAARRRFVRRQYIPLPENSTREKQLRTLLANQRHELSEEDVEVLVKVTDGMFPLILTPTSFGSFLPLWFENQHLTRNRLLRL